MWKQFTGKIGRHLVRGFSTSKPHNLKVCVCGAKGGIGQPLSLILKTNPLVSDITLYDVTNPHGLAVDLSHISTIPIIRGFCGPDNLKCALTDSDLVVIVAGAARKSGMQRSDLFKMNANVVGEIVSAITVVCPKALIVVITNPVNSLIPFAAEVLKKAGCYDPNRLFGVTTLDVVRSRAFTSEHLSIEPHKVKIDVIGGHSDITILPVFSNAEPRAPIQHMEHEEIEKLTIRIQDAGKEVIEAKAGEGSATLSMSYSAGLFVNALLMGLKGLDHAPVECSYVQSDVVPEVEFFSTPLRFGMNGIKENLGLPPLSEYEQNLLKCLIPQLKKDIEMGKGAVK